MELTKIGVIGTGVMECDISTDLSFQLLNVVLVDVSCEKLEAAKTIKKENFRMFQFLDARFKPVSIEDYIPYKKIK